MTSSSPMADLDTPTTDANDSLPKFQIPNFTNQNNEFDKFLHEYNTMERYLTVIIPIVYGVIFVLGTIGNLLVILAVSFNKQMRTRTNVFILSLAVADLLYITVCLPFDAIIAAYDHNWPFDPMFCKTRLYAMYVSFYASVYTLLGMSFNRFLAVVFPISSAFLRTRINAIRTVLALWLIILLANIPVLFVGEQTDPSIAGSRTYCIISGQKQKVFYRTLFVFGYAIPVVLMCILYGMIATQLLRKALPDNSNSSQVKTRATRMCFVVVIVFALCFLPAQVYCMMIANDTQIELNHLVAFYAFAYVASMLSYMNSCVNPFLYAFLSVKFRSSFKKVMRCNSTRMLTRSSSRTTSSLSSSV